MTLWLSTQVETVEPLDKQRLRLRCSNGQSFEANALLLALGRRANLAELGLDKAGIATPDGRLVVNDRFQTSASSVYAIGDLVSPLPLAHVATREAEVAVAAMCGEAKPIDYAAIPRCVYTWPEAAAVGLSESQARQGGFSPRVDRYHFAASAKALIEEETEGVWLLVSDGVTGRILGGQIIGPHATELIHVLSLSMKASFTIDQIADTVFAHPSLSEGFQEVARRAQASRQRSANPSSS
jgi:dihydrolipoamide dehydrogenase